MSDRARLRAFGALSLARFREFYREPEVVFWSFIFPILLAVGLGLAFRNRPPEASSVAVLEGPGSAAVAAGLGGGSLLKVGTLGETESAQALRLGRGGVGVGPGGARAGAPVGDRPPPPPPGRGPA